MISTAPEPTTEHAPGETAGVVLGPLRLPAAPPVVRGTPAPVRRRRAPAVVLLVLGVLLALGPIVGGLFAKAASGQQMLDAFAPHLTSTALDQYDADLGTIRRGTSALNTVYGQAGVRPGRYPGADQLRTQGPAIDARASDLLERVRAAKPDYDKVAGIGGFDRLPFLVVAAGLTLAYAGAVLLGGRRQRAGGAILLALAAAVALVGYPLVSGLPAGGRAGNRLQHALAPVMTERTVRAEQEDFIVLVHGVGEIDTSFKAVPRSGRSARDLAALDRDWPTISSDLAGLVGAINDNLDNDRALGALDDLTGPVSGLASLPWLLLGAGVVAAIAAVAARPRPRKETP